ncbi:hypothetical protein D3C73_1532100 [compost metagenome]
MAFFFIRPYRAKEPARTSDIHGSLPCSTVTTTTPISASPIAAHCPACRRSFRNTTPKITLRSGFI